MQSAMEVDTVPDVDAKSAARSCTTCAKAKAKCVREPGQDICERCSRLKKDCQMREPVVRKRKIVKHTRAAQLEKLESKIEHLVNALSTSQARQQIGHEYGQPSPPISASSRLERSDSTTAGDSQRESRTHQMLTAMCPNEPDPSSHGHGPHLCERGSLDSARPSPVTSISQTTPGTVATAYTSAPLPPLPVPVLSEYEQYLGVNFIEAEVLFDRYRRLMARYVPFVPIKPEATARSMMAENPFLMHAICVVASFHDISKQQRMLKELLRDISERMLINGEKSVDLLQGILVTVSWYHPHIFWLSQITNLLHLGSAMLKDLNLDRLPMECDKSNFKAAVDHATHGPGRDNNRKVASLQEHRCLTGIFYLTSTFASSFKKADAIAYTAYMQSCLRTLEQVREYESDLLLVQLVRLQHVCEELHTTDNPSAPMQLYAKAFGAEVDRLKENDATIGLDYNLLLDLQYRTTEILVWELALIDLQEPRPTVEYMLKPRGKARRDPLRYHLDDLYKCVQAIKNFLDVYFTIPADVYLLMPFSVFGQFAHCFILAVRLASLEMEGWDYSVLNTELDFSSMLEEAGSRFEAAAKSSPDGIATQNDAFFKWSQRIRWMKSVYESKFQEAEKATEQAQKGAESGALPLYPEAASAQNPQQQQPTPPDDILSGDFFQYMDENFWNSFAGDYDFTMPDMNMAL